MPYKLNPFTNKREFIRDADEDGSATGSNTQVQYNNGGALGASSNFTFNSSTNTLTVGGNIVVTGTVDGVDISTLSTTVTTLDAQNVKLTGDQTIAGVKTFSSFPVTPSSYPTTDYQASNKKYVDDRTGSYISKTANYTLTSTDYTVDCTSGTFELTLPTAVGTNKVYNLKNTGTGTITVNTTSSQTIDGFASGVIKLYENDNLMVQSNGANWIII